MPDPASPDTTRYDSPTFVKAVTDLGERRPVVSSTAIYNDKGVKLIERGVAIDGRLYDHLVAHRLSLPLDACVHSPEGVDGAVLRKAVEDALERRPFFGQMAPVGRPRGRLLEAIEAIALPAPLAFQLTLTRENRAELFDHSILMAILCAHLVSEGGATLHDMAMAAAAGLLHDVGMLHIDAELLASGARLTGDERKPLYAHPLTGSMQVSRFHVYPREVARAILEHHERMDGSGYPRGLSGSLISPLGRVLSLAEVVTAMFNGQRRYPEQRVSLLLRMSPRRYDPDLMPSMQRLLRNRPPPDEPSSVPNGEALNRLVQLADLLGSWPSARAGLAAGLSGANRSILDSIGEQIETLQRMLHQAGVTGGQLAHLGESETFDDALRIELWALEQEVDWHLRTIANQLQRRWHAEAASVEMPSTLKDWVARISAIDKAG